MLLRKPPIDTSDIKLLCLKTLSIRPDLKDKYAHLEAILLREHAQQKH
jgi:hypothetical protein